MVGSWGAANTAPSGLSAAVTRSAAKGSAIGDPGVKGPEVATGASVEGVDAVVGVDEAVEVVVVPAWCLPDALFVGAGLELHDASTRASSANDDANPTCRRRPGRARIGASMACAGGRYGATPWSPPATSPTRPTAAR